ncbi:MAG: hypothetical protein RMJ39_10210 [Deltaproteobacteria bacterium]|nr:hypothetical protein [Deltaproteobacteria bacterium]
MEPILKVQGDVYFVKTEELPSWVKLVTPRGGRYVLARGEATGHAHAIEDTENVTLYEVNGTLYLKVDNPVTVVHEEHKPINLEPGIWRVGIQREYDYFELVYRNVYHIVRPIRD